MTILLSILIYVGLIVALFQAGTLGAAIAIVVLVNTVIIFLLPANDVVGHEKRSRAPYKEKLQRDRWA